MISAGVDPLSLEKLPGGEKALQWQKRRDFLAFSHPEGSFIRIALRG
jgi:hypothetical protein